MKEAAENIARWQSRWQESHTPWDLGGPHPELTKITNWLADLNLKLTNVYVPGCGRAHDGAAFAKLGFQVTAADYVPEAIESAKSQYERITNLKLIEEDCLTPSEPCFDLIYDQAMLCALQPDNRPRYVEACVSRLKPGGIFASILFSSVKFEDPDSKGPPFQISLQEMFDLFEPTFSLLKSEVSSKESPIPIIHEETIAIWRLKGTNER